MRHLLCAVLALLLAGCVASYRIQVTPPAGSLMQYTSVAVPPVEVNPWLNKHPHVRDDAAYVQWRNHINLATGAIPAAAKMHLAKAYRLVEKPVEGTFVVKTELILFEPDASLGGTGGKGRIGVLVSLWDPATGQEFGRAESYASVSVGGFAKAHSTCARSIARFIGDHRR